jgi:cytochrome c oxidase subunit 2
MKNIYTIMFLIFEFNNLKCDAPENWQLYIQDHAASAAEAMLNFHDQLMLFLIAVGICVFWFLFLVVLKFNKEKQATSVAFTHSSTLEILWTILPAIVLLMISVPSFSLLYTLDDQKDPDLTVKIVGHQWYWSYEYSDIFDTNEEKVESVLFDSYMITTDDLLTTGGFRLLEVDKSTPLPVLTNVRLLITSADVLHSWAVPSLGIKVDACPGRLSEASVFVKRIPITATDSAFNKNPNMLYGQCSEICGLNHAFMPIKVELCYASKLKDLLDARD